jgi:hypothetical protein
MKKRAVNPSGLSDYARCKYLYFVRHILGLGPKPKVEPKRELGSFVHACETSLELEGNPETYVNREMKKIRVEAGYKSVHTPLLERIKLEAWKITSGGTWVDGKNKKMTSESYLIWRDREILEKGYEFTDIEERFWVDIGPLILCPKTDRVLWDDNERPWSYEVKVTGRWDDGIFGERWKLDHQTTLQAIAIESKYDTEVGGAMVEVIQHTRQSSTKPENKGRLMPISKVERLPLKWVRKPREVIAHMQAWLEELGPEMDARERDSNWPLDGMAARSCDLCGLRQHCVGNIPREKLLPTFDRDGIRKWNKARGLKKEVKK